MIKIVGEKAFELDGEFVDLIVLYTRIALIGDGKRVHDLNSVLGIVLNYYDMYRKQGSDENRRSDEERIRVNYKRLKQLLGP